jgi:hypothetical protein
METHFDRLKLLFKKRSLGGWLVIVLAVSWRWLEHLHTAVWVVDHLFPNGWPRIMFHPNYITIGLFGLGLVWFTFVLLWPERQHTPNLWLEFDPNETPSDDRTLRIQNGGNNPIFDVVVKIPSESPHFVSDPINRLPNDKNWVPCKRNRMPEYLKTVRNIVVEEVLRGTKDEIPVLISYRDHERKHRKFSLVIPLPLRDGIQFALPKIASRIVSKEGRNKE